MDVTSLVESSSCVGWDIFNKAKYVMVKSIVSNPKFPKTQPTRLASSFDKFGVFWIVGHHSSQ